MLYGESEVLAGINNRLSKYVAQLSECGWCTHRLWFCHRHIHSFIVACFLRLLLFPSLRSLQLLLLGESLRLVTFRRIIHSNSQILLFVAFSPLHTLSTPPLSVGGAKMKLTFKVRPSSLVFARQLITDSGFFSSTGFETTKIRHRCGAIGDGKS